MASPKQCFLALLCLSLVVAGQAFTADDFDTYTSQGITYSPDGTGVTLALLNGQTASGMGTKGSWLFGSFGAWIKLPAGNAAGTVATLYMSSPAPQQCEYDFEFLGHNQGLPRKIHTNVFVDGKGGREQQIYMPGNFDPTAAFHYYSFEWHADQVVFYVDWKPIRQFKNLAGVIANGTYCDHKAMGLYLSIWDGSGWATEGGGIKIDWSQAPFECEYQNFNLNGCPVYSEADIATCKNDPHSQAVPLTPEEVQHMTDIRNNATLVKYNYCTDNARYPNLDQDYPECSHNAM
jgi:xyloglucan:xyloglucosyl transferase